MATSKKKKTSKKLKSDLWKVFSEYIRLIQADRNLRTECVTCGVKKFWKGEGIQAGHFISRRYLSTMFEETNVHPQCIACNIFLNGNMIQYYEFMEKTYGKKEIKRLQKLKDKIIKRTPEWYEGRIKHYRRECTRLLGEKLPKPRRKSVSARKTTKT